MRRKYPAQIEHEEYLNSGRWKCDKSPSGSHYWIVKPSHIGGLERVCKYCNEVRKIKTYYKDRTYPKNWRKV